MEDLPYIEIYDEFNPSLCWRAFNPINGLVHEQLTLKAQEKLLTLLQGYGNDPGAEQCSALLQVLYTYTSMAMGTLEGRFAFPLATGLGKTQSIVAWLSTVYGLGHTHVSLSVCASKVEALCDLKRDLVANGIPESKIGLLHSYRFDPRVASKYLQGELSELPLDHASAPSIEASEAEAYQFLLVTHNRVKGRGSLETFNTFQGRPRDLMIWDESLLVSDSRCISRLDLKAECAALDIYSEKSPALKPVVVYLQSCIEVIEDEIQHQREGHEARPLEVPPVENLRSFKEALKTRKGADTLRAFLNICQEPLRVVDTQEEKGIIYYDIVVPSELKNIVILDASYPIRELEQIDRSIQLDLQSNGGITYENVKVHHLRHSSSRTEMTRQFKLKQEDRAVSNEVIDVVKSIPESEGVLIFTFKERDGVDFKKTLERDLRAAKVTSELPEGRARFVFLTWGQETSISKFSYCSNVIFAGVLHRSYLDLAGCVVGQEDNLLHPISNEDLKRVRMSEMAHCLYQAMCRGSARILKSGSASPIKVWLIHKDKKIRKLLNTVMPGLQWVKWNPRHLVGQGKIMDVAEQIEEHLEQMTQDKVSTSQLRKTLGLKEIPRQTWNHALAAALEELPWELEGRSLVRVTAATYGFV